MKNTKRKKVKTEMICFKVSPRWKKHIQKSCPKGKVTDTIMKGLIEQIGEPPLTPGQLMARELLK